LKLVVDFCKFCCSETVIYNTTEQLYRALTKTSLARERVMLHSWSQYKTNSWIFNFDLDWATDRLQ